MRALDPRLVQRARPVRSMLAADAVLGLVAALLVIAQAVLIARVAAVAGRAAAAWGFEVVGRRAATSVQSQLRNELVEKRLRSRPAALDGAESAELATIAVSGVDALETTFGRPLEPCSMQEDSPHRPGSASCGRVVTVLSPSLRPL